MAANRPGNGPYSKLLARGVVKGTSRNGRFLKAVRAELTEGLGGEPLTAAQRILIDRIAWLRLYVLMFDEKLAKVGTWSTRDRNTYLAFSNSLVRATRALGRDIAAPEKRPNLHDYLRARSGEAAD